MKAVTLWSIFATAALTSATAGVSAADPDPCPTTTHKRYMLMVIDGSGSMTQARASGGTRFDAAKTLADKELVFFAGQGPIDGVAVYTFTNDGVNNGLVQQSNNNNPLCPGAWITPDKARELVQGTTLVAPLPSFRTPLANSMCDAIKILRDKNKNVDGTTRILHVSTDGEENSSARGLNLCGGDYSTTPNYPWDEGSWQNNVLNQVRGTPPVDMRQDEFMRIILFQRDPIVGFAAPKEPANLEGGASKMAAAIGLSRVTDLEFFSQLATKAGGTFAVALDNAPLPVSGDLGGDTCIDHSDAFEVLRRFGQTVPAVDAKYDLNMDRVVSYADYADLVSKIQGTCGQPDTLAPINPIVCSGNSPVVIDGKSLETASTAIDVRGSCQITIRNSRIVAGQNAIVIRGSAEVTLEDSIIAGDNALVVLNGSARVTVSGTYFKGDTDIRGSWQFIDHGGNTWE